MLRSAYPPHSLHCTAHETEEEDQLPDFRSGEWHGCRRRFPLPSFLLSAGSAPGSTHFVIARPLIAPRLEMRMFSAIRA